MDKESTVSLFLNATNFHTDFSMTEELTSSRFLNATGFSTEFSTGNSTSWTVYVTTTFFSLLAVTGTLGNILIWCSCCREAFAQTPQCFYYQHGRGRPFGHRLLHAERHRNVLVWMERVYTIWMSISRNAENGVLRRFFVVSHNGGLQ